jgi:hypothetical protein
MNTISSKRRRFEKIYQSLRLHYPEEEKEKEREKQKKQTNQFIAQFKSSITEDFSVARVAPTEYTDPPELASWVAFFHSRLLLFSFFLFFFFWCVCFQFNPKPLNETNQNKKANLLRSNKHITLIAKTFNL